MLSALRTPGIYRQNSVFFILTCARYSQVLCHFQRQEELQVLNNRYVRGTRLFSIFGTPGSVSR